MRRRAALLLAGLGLAGAAGQAPAQVTVTGSAVVGVVEHRVDAGNGLEGASGTVFGAAGKVLVGPHVEIGAMAASGTLTASTPAASNQTFAGADLRAVLIPEPWLALSAGLTLQDFDGPAARQRWTATRVGAELRLPFVTGALTGFVRGELLPTVSVSGLTKPQSAFAAASGLTWEGGILVGSLAYGLERYDFPRAAGFQRHEQLSALTVRLGLRLGARVAR